MENVESLKQITVRQVPADLWRQLKIHAAEKETTVQATVMQALREYLKRTA
jgi:plasmid stability protein